MRHVFAKDDEAMRRPDQRLMTVPSAVHIGGTSKGDLLAVLREHGIRLNTAADALFDDHRFTTLDGSRVIEIVIRSVADLGFERGATYGELTTRASGLGWVECPLEVGPHLRLQFLDQPEAPAASRAATQRAPPGSITVASPPLDDTDETPKGFYLMRFDGALWLRGYWSAADHVWSPDDVLLFSNASPKTHEACRT
jgi:hypothetical protein